jgi:hypothetical protein
LEREDFVVTCHHDDCAKFEALGAVHGAQRYLVARSFDRVFELHEWNRGKLDRRTRSGHLLLRPHEHSDFMGMKTLLQTGLDPLRNDLPFFISGVDDIDAGRRAVEYGHCTPTFLLDAIYVGKLRREEAISLRADLVGGSIVDSERA